MRNFAIDNFEKIVMCLSLVITGIFWIFTISNLPQRVQKVEKRVDVIESEVKDLNRQFTATDVKVNLILSDTNAIKNYFIRK